jgi:Flp pilus assembly protein TadD
MTERDIERWTREVAEDPGASSFVKLARAYRTQGRSDAARSVVIQGLQQNPEHIGGHGLLALIHVETGEREKAGDEWQTMLSLEPDNFEASRGLGFLALERDDLAGARRYLEQADRSQPGDTAVAQALRVLERREAAGDGARVAVAGNSGGSDGARATARRARRRTPAAPGLRDPEDLFAVLRNETPFLGAVVLDARGLVVAGGIELENGSDELLAGLISTAVEEAKRAAEMVGLGSWDGLLLDCADATVHVAGLSDIGMVVVAARQDAPAGWAVRTARRAQALARNFLQEHA